MENTTLAASGRVWLAAGALAGMLSTASNPVLAQRLPAFPGAEGAGRYVTGGRGTATSPTTVFEVTSLLDSNTPGTLRYALGATAASRTIVFRVCGTIHLTSALRISRANTTIAGQTAPGDGICLADYPVSVNADNVIVRFLRFRMGDKNQNLGMVNGSGNDDSFGGLNHSRIVVDHCTMSWSDDEAFTFYGATTDSMTLQWNLISEPLNYSYHFETGDRDYERHGYGGIWGGRYASFHHNLFAHCTSRCPRWNGARYGVPIGSENCDFRNNVVYNWGSNNTYGGEGGNYNMVGNYYKYGPNSSSHTRLLNPDQQTTAPVLPYPQVYLAGNVQDGSANITSHNWRGVVMQSGNANDTTLSKVNTPFPFLPITPQSATDAYAAVLAGVGCVLPARDVLDQRIIQDVQNRTGRIIDVQGGFAHGTPYAQTVGAWPALACGPAPADTDHDGMTDTWETSHGLNPNDPTDRFAVATNGYTNLENYLNGLVAVLATAPAQAGTALEVFPNPTPGAATVRGAAAHAPIQVLDALGRTVLTAATDAAGTAQLALPAGVAPGVYVVKCGAVVRRLEVE